MIGRSAAEPNMIQPDEAGPRSAYLHVPFCRHRCGYCNFSVVAGRDDLIDRFLSAIDHEMRAWDRPSLQTLFIGGGTPTHLNREQLDRFFDSIRAHASLDTNAEITAEANPEDITPDKIAQLASLGVNRISLGVQSFEPAKIKSLERGHDRDAAVRAIELAADHIGNVSIDLIFGAPNETLESWQNDLRTALELPIDHLSTYGLTIEKGTRFFNAHSRGELTAVDEDVDVAMYQAAREETREGGMTHYEVSSFARPQKRCRHNLAYWKGQDWLAAGPGAAAFVGGVRTVNHRSTTTYLKRIENEQSPVAETETLTNRQRSLELAAFGVRMIDGVDFDEIATRTGVDAWSICEDAIHRCHRDGLIEIEDQHVRLSEHGVLFADTVAREFLSD